MKMKNEIDIKVFAEFMIDTESGYFISGKWWKNNDTIAVISLGEKDKQLISYMDDMMFT